MLTRGSLHSKRYAGRDDKIGCILVSEGRKKPDRCCRTSGRAVAGAEPNRRKIRVLRSRSDERNFDIRNQTTRSCAVSDVVRTGCWKRNEPPLFFFLEPAVFQADRHSCASDVQITDCHLQNLVRMLRPCSGQLRAVLSDLVELFGGRKPNIVNGFPVGDLHERQRQLCLGIGCFGHRKARQANGVSGASSAVSSPLGQRVALVSAERSNERIVVGRESFNLSRAKGESENTTAEFIGGALGELLEAAMEDLFPVPQFARIVQMREMRRVQGPRLEDSLQAIGVRVVPKWRLLAVAVIEGHSRSEARVQIDIAHWLSLDGPRAQQSSYAAERPESAKTQDLNRWQHETPERARVAIVRLEALRRRAGGMLSGLAGSAPRAITGRRGPVTYSAIGLLTRCRSSDSRRFLRSINPACIHADDSSGKTRAGLRPAINDLRADVRIGA